MISTSGYRVNFNQRRLEVSIESTCNTLLSICGMCGNVIMIVNEAIDYQCGMCVWCVCVW